MLALLFIVGSILGLEKLSVGTNFLVVPSLLLYYRIEAKTWFIPIVISLLLFYVRDIFLLWGGLQNYPEMIMYSFLMALFIIFVLVITNFQRSRMHPIELVSLMIMYGFLTFVLITVGDLVPEVIPSYKNETYLYLFLLSLLLALSFTQYLMKSHYSSLWLMLATASLLISELSLFFKLFVVEDISVNVFFPVFHVFTYFSLVQHGLHRRKTSWIPYF